MPQGSVYTRGIWTSEEIIAAAKRWATWAGRSPAWSDWNRSRVAGEPMHPSTKTAIVVFGSWLGMVRAAGLSPAPVGAPRQWTCDAIIACLLDHAATYGAFPFKTDWDTARPDRPHASQVIRRFGTWRKAIAAARGEERAFRVDAAPVAEALREFIGPNGSAYNVAELLNMDVSPLYKLLAGKRPSIDRDAADRILTVIDRPDVLVDLEPVAA